MDIGMRGTFMSGGVRHGSGASASRTGPSSARRGRGQRTPSPARRSFMPGGPVTASEWDDVVQHLQGQIYKLNKSLADHAHAIGVLKSELENGSIPTIVQRIQTLENSVDSRFAGVDTRFIDGGNKVDQRFNSMKEGFEVLRAEIRSFAAGLNHPPVAPNLPPGVVPENFNVANPAPVHSGNPWAHIIGNNAGPKAGAHPQFASPHVGSQPAAAPMGQQRNDFGVASPISSYGMGTGGATAGVGAGVGFGNGGHVVGNSVVNHPPNVRFGASGVDNSGGQWASQHHRQFQRSYSTIHAPMWNSYDNTDYQISKKFVNDLPMFNGDHSKYSHWKNKLTDHCCDTNPYWRALLKICQETGHVIEYAPLANSQYGRFSGWDLSLDLWNFASKRLGQDIYDKRLQLAHGVEGNSFELWRALFVEYEGSDEYIALDGRTKLQNFLAMTMTNGITQVLNDWSHAMLKYGGDIGPVTRRTMLLKILPESLRTDVLKHGFQTTDEIIAWIKKTNDWSDREHRLKLRKGAVAAVTIDHHETHDRAPAPGGVDIPQSPAGVSPELIAAIVAAVGGKQQPPPRGRRPQGGSTSPRTRSQSPASAARASYPKDACYHCKGKGHSRTANEKIGRKGCDAFAKILKDNGGSLPKGYEGAFEKHVKDFKAKAKTGKVNALNDEEMLQMLTDEDDSDSDFDTPVCGAVWKSVGPPSCNPFVPDFAKLEFPPPSRDPVPKTKISNSFGALVDASPSDGSSSTKVAVDRLADELRSCGHRVLKSSAKQSKPKGWVIESDADVNKLEKLFCGANQQQSAKALRHLQLESELDDAAAFVERKSTPVSNKCRKVWTMVDSGSFVTIANCAKVFPGHTVHPSPGSIAGVKYSNASGGDIANRGQVTISHRMNNGTEIDVPFQDGDVQVPIISVKDFVHNKSVVKFKKREGTIKLPTGSILQFVEKFGVYFICLNVVSGVFPDGDGNLDSPMISTNDVDHTFALDTLDRAIQALATEDLSHLDADVTIPPPPDPCDEGRCRHHCCSRGRRQSSFTRPVP